MKYFRYFVALDSAVLAVRYWPFDRCFIADDMLSSRLTAPDTWLSRRLR